MSDEYQDFQPGGFDDPAAGGNVSGQGDSADGQGAQGDAASDPMAALQAKVSAMEQALTQGTQELQRLRDENLIMRHQMRGGQGASQQDQESPDMFPGMEDGDVLTVAEMKQVLGKFSQNIAAQLGGIATKTTTPDFDQVIETYLPDVLRSDPYLADTIRLSKNPAKTAYILAKSNPKFKAAGAEGGKTGDTLTDALAQAKKAEANLKKPGTGGLSPAGGGAKNAGYWENLSDADFEKELDRIKMGGFR